MKTLFLSVLCMCAISAHAQVTRKGDTFCQVKKTIVRDTLVTKYKYESQGKTYPIVLNKKTGSCYIWKVSKNGKGYRQYMSKEIKETICKELKINIKK